MRPFRYTRDPLFLCGCLLYALNRWLLKPYLPNLLLNCWFNDTLLIPCALPPLLLLYRWLKLRPAEAVPTLPEVVAHCLGWSLLFEVIGPHLMRHATGDPWDILAYAVGAGAAWFWWNRDLPPLVNEL